MFKLRSGPIDATTRDGVVELVGGVLELVGRFLQSRTVPPARFGPNEVWIPDADDTEAIAGPIANMAARRIPSGMGSDSDVADLFALTAGTAGYVARNSRLTAAHHRAARAGAFTSNEGVPLDDAAPGPRAA